MTNILVKSGVKVKLNELAAKDFNEDVNVSGDFTEELEKELEQYLAKVVGRTIQNNRKTVQGKDL